MLQINAEQIFLQQSAPNKKTAIEAIAKHLVEAGNVEDGYVNGMLERESQHSTFLGNGIAIPHGTTDTRDLVKQTGLVLHHFPQGLQWDEENRVYLAIGIAAKSDEHLTILKQLTRVLSEDGVEEALKDAKDAETLIAILSGETATNTQSTQSGQSLIDESLVQVNFPAHDMVQLQAVAAGLLHRAKRVDQPFIAHFVSQIPVHLGEGVWLLASKQFVKQPALAVVSAEGTFEYQQQPTKVLIAIASGNNDHQIVLSQLQIHIQNRTLASLREANREQLIASLTGKTLVASTQTENAATPTDAPSNDASSTSLTGSEQIIESIFVIRNPHGLHARPSAVLVNEAKKYTSAITVENITQGSEIVNAKSLMKIMTLGVKSGSELKFTATGEDAEAAIAGIGEAIASGLGE